MPEHDPQVISYRHLVQKPRADDALNTLKKVASVVKPIMRAHKWKVKELAEFYPNNTNLLGVNVNRGAQICLRLRYPGDASQFLPLDSVVDTMLHELCHMVHGPHNAAFHALWDKLRDEYTELVIKGFTGEGFLSNGHRLGGSGANPRELRRLSHQAAQQRQGAGTVSAGYKLGGKAPMNKLGMRKAVADAVDRRNINLVGCEAEQQLSQDQVMDLSQSATTNGFRTKAEEDEANDIAIAAALAELMELEERNIVGTSAVKIPASSRLLANKGGPLSTNGKRPRAGTSDDKETKRSSTVWVCQICTLQNPPTFLCCDACGAERSDSKTGKKKETSIIDLT